MKKLREIQNAAWQVNNQLDGGTGLGEGDTAVSVSCFPVPYIWLTSPMTIYMKTQEVHRPHLIAIERLILQTICFNFNLHRSPTVPTSEQLFSGASIPPEEQAVGGKDVFGWVVRFGRSMGGKFSL